MPPPQLRLESEKKEWWVEYSMMNTIYHNFLAGKHGVQQEDRPTIESGKRQEKKLVAESLIAMMMALDVNGIQFAKKICELLS